MAQIPTAEQTVFPEQGGLPNASPAAFGAPVARAEQEIGGNLGQTGDILGQRALAIQGLKNEATANDADVSFQTDLGKLEDTYYGLKGQAASAAYPKFQQDVQALRKQYLGQMGNPMAANMLDQSLSYTIARSMRQGGMYAGEQTRQWVTQSQEGKVGILRQQIARNFNDDSYFAVATQGIKDGVEAMGQTEGWPDDYTQLKVQEQLAGALKDRQDAAYAAIKGLPLDQQTAALAGSGDATAAHVRAIEADPRLGYTTPGGGAYQVHGGPVNEKSTPAEQDAYFNDEWAKRGTALTTNLGRPVSGAEQYLAWQQGVAGATALLKNPNAPAAEALSVAYDGNVGKAYDALKANLPTGIDPATIKAGQFAGFWEQKWAQTAPTGVAGNDPANWAAQLAPDQRQKLSGEILTEARAQQSQQETDTRYAQWQQQQAANEAEAGYKQKMLMHSLDPSQPPADLSAAARDPALANDKDALPRLISFNDALLRTPASPGQSGANTSALFSKIFPSDGSPGLTQKDVDAAFTSTDPNVHINKDDYNFLTKQLTDASDPASKRYNGMATGVFKNVERQIDPSIMDNMGGSTHSPYAGTRMLQYRQAVQQKIADFRAAGKDPSVLFDPTPGNKDYVGSPGFIHPYTRSLDDLMAEETGPETPPEPTAATEANDAGITPDTNANSMPAPTYQPSAAIPTDLPKGTTYYGKSKDGRDVFKTPDGKFVAAKPKAQTDASAGYNVPLGP